MGSRINMFNLSALMLSVTVGLYTGIRFFEPIVVERLREDGNLRSDMEFPEYDDEGNPIVPEVEALKQQQISQVMQHPEKKSTSVTEQIQELQNFNEK